MSEFFEDPAEEPNEGLIHLSERTYALERAIEANAAKLDRIEAIALRTEKAVNLIRVMVAIMAGGLFFYLLNWQGIL